MVDKYGILYYIIGVNQVILYGVPSSCVHDSTVFRTSQVKSTDFRLFGFPYKIEVPIMYNMYNVIEGLCDSRGIKVGKMCADLEISRGILGDLKAGRTKSLSAQNLEKISGYFGVSSDFILGKEKAPTQEDEREITFDDFTFAMQNESKDLTEADKQILLSMAKQLNDARKKRNGESK